MAQKHQKKRDYFICPCCGAEVAVGSPACRECGASDEFGWDEGHWWDDELPTGYSSDETFDCVEFVGEEFPEHATPKYRVKRRIMAVVALITCLAFLAWMWMQRLAPPQFVRQPGGVTTDREELIREFGFGPSQDLARDAQLRHKIIGRWERADSARITLEFIEGGQLSGTGFMAPYPGIDEVAEKMADATFEGQWAINDGRLRVTMPASIVIMQIDVPDDRTLRLFDRVERIDQGYIYRRK
jgi:hypothetical protein